jgi:hypothetical protein
MQFYIIKLVIKYVVLVYDYRSGRLREKENTAGINHSEIYTTVNYYGTAPGLPILVVYCLKV